MAERTTIPATLDAGVVCTIRRTLEDYPAGDDWVLVLHLQGKSAAHIEATPDGDDHVLTLTAAITEALEPGGYQYGETISRGTDETLEGPYPISRGRLVVRPNLIAAAAGTLEDPNEKILRVLYTLRDRRITEDVAAYQLDGMGVTREQLKDVDALVAKYELRVRRKRRPGLFAATATVSLHRPHGTCR